MKYFWLFILLGSMQGFSQTSLYGPTISYQSQSGSMGKIGGYYLHYSEKTNMGIKLDATANFAYFRNQLLVIPEAGLTFYPNVDLLIEPFLETEINPYTVTPKVGFSIVTILDFSFGYGFDLKTKQDLKPLQGFTFSIGINIPLNFELKY